ncbi:MAG: glycoside hydrolase family 127 protein [Eubacteriales bacterium]
MLTDYRNVTLRGGFWKSKEDLNRDVTIHAVYDRFNESGRIDAFKCSWKEGDPKQPHIFWDSDVAKWMEGAAYILKRERIADLEEKVEALIDEIERNQGEDGYFNIYYTVVKPNDRFTNRDCHELYCAGHLMEAACAYYEATGRDRFLKLMEKYADYIAKVFMIEDSAKFVTPGHEEIELALYRMYRTTGEERFLKLCAFFLNNRGARNDKDTAIFANPKYAQNHLPIREQHEAFGHSVRATYLYSGMADLARETGDEALAKACYDLFDDITEKKMYVTGGIGSTHIGEAFTIPYDLPNDHAYTETCASIGMIFFANRMFQLDAARTGHPSSKYADIVELELYNGALSGLSLDGESFFYENPLEIRLADRKKITATNDQEHFPITQRVRMFGCSCCPPNLNRLLSSLGTYFYGYDEASGAVYINQFGDSEFACGGAHVSQKTGYPNDGHIAIVSDVPVYVRIPGWCRRFLATKKYEMVNGYAKFDAGEIDLEFDMTQVMLTSSVKVVKNLGRAAVRRGPVIYCAEAVDNDGDVHSLYLDRRTLNDGVAVLNDKYGVPTITFSGFRRIDPLDRDITPLYAPLDNVIGEEFRPAKISMIPYFAFANRGETDMLVFMNYR